MKNRWAYIEEETTRILLVDDDPILAECARAHLSTPASSVEWAADGAAAWTLLQSESFDIVLLDIEMPVLDGFGLLQKLRADARLSDLPVVMLTSREDIDSIDRAFRLGANSFLTKPINWRQLTYALRYVLRTTRMESELLKERKRSVELLQLTNNLLSLLKLEARTPISAIIGFADCIRQEIDGPVGAQSYVRYAEQIDQAARQLQDGLMDLIQYAQLSSGAASLSDDEYSAGKVMDAAMTGMPEARGQQRIAFEAEKPHSDFFLVCDLYWLARALRHLLDIAMTKPGVTRVRFTARRTQKGEAKFTIAYDACGAAPDSAATSLERVRREMGVGVPFARRIAELHDGELVVGSRDGESIMEIVIPAERLIDCGRDHPTNEAA